MATILEALQNARYNLADRRLGEIGRQIASSQVHNAVTLLEKGYDLYDEVEPLIEKHGSVEAVPEKR